MSEERMSEIAARERAATAGPWRFWYNEVGWREISIKRTCYLIMRCEPVYPRFPGDEDMEFIAHARSDVPWLMDRVRELEAEIERLKGDANG